MRAASRQYVVICVGAGYLASVTASLLIVRGQAQNINMQTVTIEQVDTVQQLIKKEMANGLRNRVGQPSVGHGRPDSE